MNPLEALFALLLSLPWVFCGQNANLGTAQIIDLGVINVSITSKTHDQDRRSSLWHTDKTFPVEASE